MASPCHTPMTRDDGKNDDKSEMNCNFNADSITLLLHNKQDHVSRGSKGSSKVSLRLAILYHSTPCRLPTPGWSNSCLRVGRPQDEYTIIFQEPPGPPIKYGPDSSLSCVTATHPRHSVAGASDSKWDHSRCRVVNDVFLSATQTTIGESHGQADHVKK
jgi:hypothetical protein